MRFIRFIRCLTTVAAVATLSCGAIDDSAPLVAQPKACKTLDEYLAPLDKHVAEGKLQHVGQIVRDELDVATLRAIVQLLLDTIGALPEGKLKALATTLNKPTAGDTLSPLLIALLEPLPGDAAAQPLKLPRNAELLAFSRVATACLEPSLFSTLTDVLRDSRLKPALGTLLSSAGGLGPALEAALQDAGVDGRDAVVALLRNFAVSLAAPDFDPKPIVATLDGIATGSAAIGALRDLLVIALLTVDGETDTARVAAISAFVGCFNEIDTTFALPGYLYDLAADGALSNAFAATPTTDSVQADRLDAFVAVLDVVSYLTDALAANQSARDALGQAAAMLLRPDLAVAAIPEVVALLRSDALDALPSLLADIATRPCLAQAPP